MLVGLLLWRRLRGAEGEELDDVSVVGGEDIGCVEEGGGFLGDCFAGA